MTRPETVHVVSVESVARDEVSKEDRQTRYSVVDALSGKIKMIVLTDKPELGPYQHI